MSVSPLLPRPWSPERLGEGAVLANAQLQEEPLSWDHFAVEVTERAVPVVVRCRGGLDFAYADELREAFARITERDVVVDLTRLTFVDSAGLSIMLSARRTVLDVGGNLSIRGARGIVRRVFQVAELADVLDD